MRVLILLMIGVSCLSGCESFTKRHATRAILFAQMITDEQTASGSTQIGSQQNKKHTSIASAKANNQSPQFFPARVGSLLYSGNPVYIHNNTKFSVRIDEINPGWIYRVQPSQQLESSSGHPNSRMRRPSSSKTKHPISQEQFDHFRGHELWLLTTISSVNVNDPLETKSKRYFKATNVKFDSQSYSILPLDSDEKYVFTHESDSSYRITFQLFKVDQFALKKELAKIGQNPGVVGTGKALFDTLKNTAGALVGDVLQSVWEEKASEGLALERFLLSIQATVEFHGELIVLREGDFQNRIELLTPDEVNAVLTVTKDNKSVTAQKNDGMMKPFIETPYVFLDYFKYETRNENKSITYYDENSYQTDPYKIIGDVSVKDNTLFKGNISEDLNRHAYVKFSVLQSHSAKSYIDENGKVRSHQIPETYVNTLTSVENIFKTKNSLEQEITALKAEKEMCQSGTSCATEVDKLIKEKEKQLPSKEIITALENVHGKIKNEVKLNEWKAHLTRQPD